LSHTCKHLFNIADDIRDMPMKMPTMVTKIIKPEFCSCFK
jgi:hypothetical protein